MNASQRIQAAEIIAKTSPHTLPYVLKALGMEYEGQTQRRQPTRQIDETVAAFIKECSDIDGKISSVVYASYRNYCKNATAEPISHIEFSRQIGKLLKMTTKVKRSGKRVYRQFTSKERGKQP